MKTLLIGGLMLITLVSCSDDGEKSTGGETPDVITGTVVSVETQGLTDVSSFVVSMEEERYTIQINEKTDLTFPPAHLNEHRISGEPVRVEVDGSIDELVAVEIKDG